MTSSPAKWRRSAAASRRAAAGLAVALSATLLVSGCASTTPQGRLLARLDDVTQAANSRDATAIRTSVGMFVLEVTTQGNDGRLTVAKVAQLKSIAAAVLADADLVDQGKVDVQVQASASASAAAAAAEASASAAAAASASAAAASPSPSPSPSPTPSPSPSPSSQPSPSLSPRPSPSHSPKLLPSPQISVGTSSSPSPVTDRQPVDQ